MIVYIWAAADIALLMSGILYFFCGDKLPSLSTLFSYGKSASSVECKLALLPKKYFRHFYLFSSILFSALLFLFVQCYIFNVTPPSHFSFFMNLLKPQFHTPVSKLTTLVLSTLMLIQSLRRCYESFFINIHNNFSHISVFHYIAGFAFYCGVALSILHISKPLESNKPKIYVTRNLMNDVYQFSFTQAIGVTFFIWASWHQYKAHTILANLRKDKNGQTYRDKYKIPHGDWFDYVSNPHFTAEIIIYSALCLITNKFTIVWSLLLSWVVIGQVFASVMSHQWYKRTFRKSYPHRYAIIPWVLYEVEKAIRKANSLFLHLCDLQKDSNFVSKGEVDWTTKELKTSLRSIEWDLEDLEETITIVEKNPKKFKILESEIASRRSFVENTKTEILSMKSLMSNSSKNYDKKSRQSLLGGLSSTHSASHGSAKYSRLPSPDSNHHDSFVTDMGDQQQLILETHDDQLDLMQGSVGTLKTMSRQIGDELEEQSIILDELTHEVETTDSKLDGTMKKMAKVLHMTNGL
ncbi:Syntaxin-6 [Nymphon striatum]|nr:Syntaxin-6 [Nymphon striatum]